MAKCHHGYLEYNCIHCGTSELKVGTKVRVKSLAQCLQFCDPDRHHHIEPFYFTRGMEGFCGDEYEIKKIGNGIIILDIYTDLAWAQDWLEIPKTHNILDDNLFEL